MGLDGLVRELEVLRLDGLDGLDGLTREHVLAPRDQRPNAQAAEAEPLGKRRRVLP